MKQRGGFVSNSSSSSFLLCYNDKSDFDVLKNYEGYETFMDDLAPGNEQAIVEFLHDQCESDLYSYRWYVESKNRGSISFVFHRDASLELSEMCEKLGCQSEEINNVIKEGTDLIEKDCENLDYDGISKIATKFAKLVYDGIKGKWKNLGIVGYSDNDGDFHGYMEHEFMSGIVPSHESSSNYKIVIKNEH